MLTKCKKSVFCIYFLLLFFLGTISGVLCFGCLKQSAGNQILHFSANVLQPFCAISCSQLFALLRPAFFLIALGFHPEGHRLIPFLIFIRGLLLAYYSCACWVEGGDVIHMLIFIMCSVSAYYVLAKFVYFKWENTF